MFKSGTEAANWIRQQGFQTLPRVTGPINLSQVAGHAAVDRVKSDCAYDDLIRSLDKILKDANFEELPHEDVADAHRKRTVPVEVKAEHDDFREVRFYKRGRHVEQFEVREWFGL